MDLLPPRISNSELFALLADILSVRGQEINSELRLRLIEKNLPWQHLVDLADGFGVLPPLLWALMQRALLLPIPAAATLEGESQHPTIQLTRLYQVHLARRTRQREQLVGVVSALNRASIEPLLLKGARYVLAPLGAWCEARDMRDLDLLVHNVDAERAISALAAQGYRSDPRPIPMDQHLPEMWRAGEPSVVEIHTDALSFSARKILTTEEIWSHCHRSSNDQVTFFVLPCEWQLLHGILNHQIADRYYAQRALEIKALWEFAMLAGHISDHGWKAIADHMTAMHQANTLGTCIVQTMRLFAMPCPQPVAVSPDARAHADAVFENAAAPDWLRHSRRLFDQLRFGFARETLSVRYGVDKKFPIMAMIRHLLFLIGHYRGRILYRLFGRRGARS